MKAYSVTLDIWKMLVTCLSYIALAFTAWVFLRLLSACFWLPNFLQKYQNTSFLQSCAEEMKEEDSKTKESVHGVDNMVVAIPDLCVSQRFVMLSRSEMRPVGCSGQRGCPAPVPRVRVERVEGGLLVAGVQIASTCQVALPVSAIIFLVIGSIITVIAYQGQTPEEDHEAYVLRVSNSTNSRVLGPVCLAIALLMMLAGILVCLLVKYAHSKEQKVCFHCPIHGDFFPIIPVPVSAVTRHRSRLFRRQSSPGAPPEPPQCPYSNLLSARNSVSSGEVAEPGSETGEILEKGSLDKYDIRKIHHYPGFNVPPPPDTYDDSDFYKVPPLSRQQSVELMLEKLTGRIVGGYKRRKLSQATRDSIDESSQSDSEDMDYEETPEAAELPEDNCKFVPPLPDEEELPPPPPTELPPEPSQSDDSQSQSQSLSVSMEEISLTQLEEQKKLLLAELNDVSPLCSTPESRIGKIKSVDFGTPILKSVSPYARLPSADKFSVNICDVINYENLPDSTGKYEKMSGLIRKVRTKLSKINSDP
ncbi:Zinc finger CCHC domain-containing protein 8 [Homalodisca vitripennis]|nr:Zinc finger CCHC domain-containing protein 8 [Homalodisca vitripennis]